MSYRAIYTYAWDLAEAGVEAATAEFHGTRPRHRDDGRKLSCRQVPEASMARPAKSTFPRMVRLFQDTIPRGMARSSRWRTIFLKDRDVLRELCDGPLKTNAWMVLLPQHAARPPCIRRRRSPMLR